MKVSVGISNRHVHLNKEDYELLFNDQEFSKRNDLTQKGEFASNLTVTLCGPKGEIPNVRVLGPLRNYTQVEISKTDSYLLGINPEVRNSGDLEDAVDIDIVTNNNAITRKACIIATRHIHINGEDQKKYNLYDQMYKIKTFTEKSSILENVYIKVSPSYTFELHLDNDDANSNLLTNGDYVEIIKDE